MNLWAEGFITIKENSFAWGGSFLMYLGSKTLSKLFLFYVLNTHQAYVIILIEAKSILWAKCQQF